MKKNQAKSPQTAAAKQSVGINQKKKKSTPVTKKQQKQIRSTRKLMNTKSITEHSLLTYKGDELCFFLLKPTNVSVLAQSAVRQRVSALMNVLKGFTELEMLCLNSRESFESNKQFLWTRMQEESLLPVRQLLQKDLEHLDEIQTQTATAREFLLLVRPKNISPKELYPYLTRIEKTVREQGFTVRRGDYEDIKRILAVYFSQDITSERYDNFDGERWLVKNGQSDYKAATVMEEAGVLQSFLDMIAPSVVKFNIDHFLMGGSYRCVWAVKSYPTTTEEQAILQHLGEKAGVTLHIYTRIVTASEERKILQAADKMNKWKRSGTVDVREQVAAEANLQDVATMLAAAHRNREPFFHTAVYVELISNSQEGLSLLQDSVAAELNRAKITFDRLHLCQQEGFLSVMPSGWNAFGEQFERMLPTSSVANLFPFAYSGKCDPHGFYIGYDRFGSSVIVDFNRRDEDKSNANILILGNSGQGKSYLLKLIICNLLESGKGLLCMDVENEYRDLTENLGGTYIDLTSGKYILNVLEPRLSAAEPTLEDEIIELEAPVKTSRLSQHISFLRDFFRSYKDFTEAEIDVIEIMLERLYAKFGVTDETDFEALSPADYPVLSDLYDLMEQTYKNCTAEEKQLYTPDILRRVCLGLHSMCKGGDAKFFNGHTNVKSYRFLTFGVKDLMEGGKNVKDAMLFNVLSYISHTLISVGNTAAVFEELHVFLSNPIAVEYIRNAMKRVRKRESAVVLASQNIEDFLLPEVAEYTKPLFSIPTHQFLFHPGAINGKDFMAALTLDETEYGLIRECNKGQCLMKCGAERYNLAVVTPPYKEQHYGTGGGK